METRDVIELILGSIACLAVVLAGIKIYEASHKLDATQYMWEEEHREKENEKYEIH